MHVVQANPGFDLVFVFDSGEGWLRYSFHPVVMWEYDEVNEPRPVFLGAMPQKVIARAIRYPDGSIEGHAFPEWLKYLERLETFDAIKARKVQVGKLRPRS